MEYTKESGGDGLSLRMNVVVVKVLAITCTKKDAVAVKTKKFLSAWESNPAFARDRRVY
jgi:hypothetical protein